MRTRPSSCAGFTLIELLVVSGILATIVVLFSETFIRTQAIHSESRTHLRAEEDTRLSLAALGKAILGADFETMQVLRGGTATFDPKSPPGPGDEVRFQRVASWTLAGVVLGPVERIWWRPTAAQVDDVAQPGEVVWSHDGIDVVLAPNVPARESLTDSNGDGDWDRGERFTDVNGNGRWDPGFGVSKGNGQVRLWLTSYSRSSDRRIVFASFDETWTLRN